MWTEEVRVRARELGQDGEERGLLGTREGRESIEHGVHECEGLRLGIEVECGEERDGCAEGREPDLRRKRQPRAKVESVDSVNKKSS